MNFCRRRHLFFLLIIHSLVPYLYSSRLSAEISTAGTMSVASSISMPVIAVRKAQVAHPTGDPNFSVMQGFPKPFSAEESDPFLMCDVFGPTPSKGIETNPDKFPIGWHPHRGMDILTYLTEGIGRHADSLGNRGTFSSPGMQWISVVSLFLSMVVKPFQLNLLLQGSGIEHAESGGTPAGENLQGFQIW